jgi:hypothetical protein
VDGSPIDDGGFASEDSALVRKAAANAAWNLIRNDEELVARIGRRLNQVLRNAKAELAEHMAEHEAEEVLIATGAWAEPLKMAVPGTGEVALAKTPTLPQRLAELSCGQLLMVLIIGLSVLLYMQLPEEVRSRVEGLITVLSAAIWAISKITKK